MRVRELAVCSKVDMHANTCAYDSYPCNCSACHWSIIVAALHGIHYIKTQRICAHTHCIAMWGAIGPTDQNRCTYCAHV